MQTTGNKKFNGFIKESGLITGDDRAVNPNGSKIFLEHYRCIHNFFEEQVEKIPDSPALISANKSLSYSELNARANQLAHYLRELGVGPEILVAVSFKRTVEMAVAILAVLKAGGAYVPLDPSYPKERLEHMLKDSQTAVFLTQQDLADVIDTSPAEVVCIDRDWHLIAAKSEENPVTVTTADNLAYVIYTSGSTGKPKGVMITCGNLTHYAMSLPESLNLNPSDRYLHTASISFSSSVRQLMLPLSVGAAVVIAAYEHIRDPLSLFEFVKEHGVTVLDFVPSYWRSCLDALDNESLKNNPSLLNNKVRLILSASEPLPTEIPRELASKFRSDVKMINMFGQTETSGIVCVYLIDDISALNSKTVPIGHPISNTEACILDDDLRPVPFGSTGELYLSGDSLARGYLNLSELTDKSFITNVSENGQIVRSYKTGDLARFLPMGAIEHLGRVDNQVKIRGFRVELDEVESAVSGFLSVKQCVVAARQDAIDNKKLIAYVVTDKEFSRKELRSWLESKLPDYMIPSAFVELDRLPLTPNGKIDRQALPMPDMTPIDSERNVDEFLDLIEKRLVEIWERLLSVSPIGLKDSFFELGGNSLLAIRMFAEVERSFGKSIPFATLFEAATIEKLADRLREEGLSAPIPRISRDGRLSLSFAQERLWFINQLDEKNIAYNIPDATELNGALNIEALEKAINAVAERHEILRTVFSNVNGEPVQIILPDLKITLNKIDLRAKATAERADEARRLFLEEAQTPFDLQKLPLFRTKLIQTDEKSYVFLTNFHHIVFDAWSMDCFADELSAFYAAFDAAEKAVLPDLPLQYADFAEWQRKTLTGKSFQDSLSYWKRQLEGAPVRLELPIKSPRPLVQTVSGHAKTFGFDSKSIASLDALARKSGTTRFMTLLAVYAALLYRYSNQEDIVVGSPIATRTGSQLEPLIGFFVNTLPLRLDLRGDPSFLELLNRVKQVSLDAYRHQDVPFEKIVEAVNPERSLSHSPLFQTMFVMQDEPMGNLALPGIASKPLRMERGVSMFDLTLWITDSRSGLVGEWEYNTDLFDFSTIERMTDHFEALLKNIAANSELPLSELSSITNAERKKLLVEWNNNKPAKYIEQESIHQLFETQTLRTPEATALIFQNERLTYAELNRRSNRLAQYLRGLGVGQEVLVGICVERSVEMIVGILAILKAGGAYVPMDPAYPKERIEGMLSDSKAPVMLTQQKLIGNLNSYKGKCVCLDRDAANIARQPDDNPISLTEINNLAYVIYTSGSTGKPKGVAIEHRSTVALLHWAQTVFDAEELKGVLASTSICFDLSVFEMFLPLSRGGTIILVENILHLPEAPAVNEVTLINTVPSAITELLRMKRMPKSVSTVNLAGEPLKTSLVQQIYELGTVRKVYDLYGPSEDTTYSTFALRDNGPATIGRPISNTQAYILDRHLQLVPVGIPGELYLGGDGLARGYLNQPELTAKQFVINPFSAVPGARMYKTGDLARFFPNGNIEYLGRIDNQVKIRGFRIELGEIEATLLSNPEISEASVIARENDSGDKFLVAYIVAAGDVFDVEDLRNYLKRKLPNYMVPTAFVKLEHLPLTPNGKIDRKALPAPTSSMLDTERDYVAHRDNTELQLVEIWEKLLQVAPIGIKDNFFELGGHSLLAIRMFAEIERLFGKSIPIASLFQAGTIEKLSDLLRNEDWKAPESSLVPIKPSGDKPPFFCIHGGGGDVLFYRDLARLFPENQPFYGIRARRLGGRQVGHSTIEEMAEFYIKEIQTLQPQGPYYLGGSSLGGIISYEMAQQLRSQGQEVELLALFDTWGPGYPKLLPGVSGFQTKLDELKQRVRNHKDKLAASDSKEKTAYILSGFSRLKRKYYRKINNNFKQTVRKFYSFIKRPIPKNYIQVKDQIRKAWLNYVLKSYAGRITLFRAAIQPLGAEPDSTLGWKSLAKGGLDIYEIPGAHVSIIAEPHVQILAKQLTQCIETSQAELAALKDSPDKSLPT